MPENKEKVEIKKMILTLGDKDITLSIDQAKKLYSALEEIFKEKVVHEYHYDRWYWNPYRPIYSTSIYAGGLNQTGNTQSMGNLNGYVTSNGTKISYLDNAIKCTVGGN